MFNLFKMQNGNLVNVSRFSLIQFLKKEKQFNHMCLVVAREKSIIDASMFRTQYILYCPDTNQIIYLQVYGMLAYFFNVISTKYTYLISSESFCDEFTVSPI